MTERRTLIDQLRGWAERTPDRVAISRLVNGAWEGLSWKEYWTAVRETAKGLIAIEHEVGDCVAIVGQNRPEWVICQFGIMAARGVPAPIYGTNTDEQTAYIVKNSRARIAICDEQAQYDKYRRAMAEGLMGVDRIVTMDELGATDADTLSLAAIRELGRAQDDAELDRRLADLTEEETALLIYTSGTTGVPKGVMLDHGNMVTMADVIVERMVPFQEEGAYVAVSYLPLCHVAEQLFTNFFHMHTGGEVYFCPDLTQVRDYLLKVRPTFFAGVPRVWEKFQSALESKLAQAPTVTRWLVGWARRTELACAKRQIAEGRPVDGVGRRLAQRILGRIREQLGLDRLIVAATGSAPCAVQTQEFFASLGILLHEGYGMSETSGIICTSPYGAPRFGSVGTPVSGVSVRIANDGEILAKGRNMTRGYLHMPEATAELIDSDGWLHTGDMGELSDDGFLTITGRKKDLLITAGGKNVAPSELESHLKLIEGVSLAIVVGDGKPYLAALLTLDADALPPLCARLGIPTASPAELDQNPDFRKYLEGEIDRRCNQLVARYQTIKRFRVLPAEFTVEGGEVTPTMKIRRNIVHAKYASDIEDLYQEARP